MTIRKFLAALMNGAATYATGEEVAPSAPIGNPTPTESVSVVAGPQPVKDARPLKTIDGDKGLEEG